MKEGELLIEALGERKIEYTDIFEQAFAKVAKGSFLLIIGFITAKLLMFLRQFTIIRLLSPSDYGLFSLGFIVATLGILLGNMGLQSGAQRYIAFHQERGEQARARGVILSSIRLLTISSTLVVLCLILLSGPLAKVFGKPDMKTIICYFAPFIPLSMCVEMLSSFYMGFKRVGVRVFIESIGLNLTSLIFILLFLLFYRNVKGAILGLLMAYALVMLAGLVYASRTFPLSLSRAEERAPMGREILAFSLPLFGVYALNFFMEQTDTLMLGHFSTASLLGIYNAAFVLSSSLPFLLAPVASIFMPVASGLVAREALTELKILYQTVTKWVFAFTLPLFLIFFLFPRDTLGLLFGSEYPSAYRALQLLCVGEFINIFLGPNVAAIIAFGHSRILMANFLASAATNVVLNLLFIPRMGINGAAIASFLALALVNGLNSFYLWRRHGVHPFNSTYVKYTLIIVLVAIILYPPFQALLRLSRWMLIATAVLFFLMDLLIMKISGSIDNIDRTFYSFAKERLMKRVEKYIKS